MGVVAAYTGEFMPRPMSFRGRCYRVVSDGMPPFDTFHTMMATDTKFIDRFKKHEFFISGMGIMAGNTALSEYNAMNIGKMIIFVYKILFVIVTGDANHEGTFGPQLIAILTPMGVMAQSTSPDQCTMSIFTGLPGFSARVAGETCIINSAFAKTYSPGLHILLMASKALLV
jgi:hypothetical protein